MHIHSVVASRVFQHWRFFEENRDGFSSAKLSRDDPRILESSAKYNHEPNHPLYIDDDSCEQHVSIRLIKISTSHQVGLIMVVLT